VAGRPLSWTRKGKCRGHHRGLRAGHAFIGVTRERGRATCLLAICPDWDPGRRKVLRGAGAFTTARAPWGHHERTEAGQGSGSERRAQRPETGMVAVLAEHSTDEGGDLKPTGPRRRRWSYSGSRKLAKHRRRGTAHASFSASPITGHEHVGGLESSNAEQLGNGSGGPRRRCGNGVATTARRLCHTSIGCCA
jgi:hypothetical protein